MQPEVSSENPNMVTRLDLDLLIKTKFVCSLTFTYDKDGNLTGAPPSQNRRPRVPGRTSGVCKTERAR